MAELAVRTRKAPLQRSLRQMRVVRSLLDIDTIIGTPTAIYIALDASKSMGLAATGETPVLNVDPESTRWYAQITGIVNLLRAIRSTGLQHSLSINFFPNRVGSYPELPDTPVPEASTFVPFQRFDVAPADIDDAIDYLLGIRTPTSADLGFPTPYDQGVEAAPSFFTAATQTDRVVLFFTDGGPLPTGTVDDANDILGPLAADVYYYRFLSSAVTGLALDNTPADGTPVFSTLDALSWGLWTVILTPTTFVTPGEGGEPDEERETAALVMRVSCRNITGSVQTVALRYRRLATNETFLIASADVPIDGHVEVDVAKDIVESGAVLEARTSLGGEVQVTADYLELLQEVVET